jgi:hypothetical protein
VEVQYRLPIAVEDCQAMWLLWLLCIAMSFAIIDGSKTEFADAAGNHVGLF